MNSSSAASPPTDPTAGAGPSRRWLGLLKWAVSAGLIAWVLSRVELGDILATAAGADFGLLAAAFALLFVGCMMSTVRWRILLHAQGIHATHGFLYGAFLIGIFFSNFLPTTVGGDAVRVYDTWRLGATRSRAVAIVIVDRFLGVIALTVFAVAAFPFARTLTGAVPLLELWLLAGLAIVALVALMIFAPPTRMLTLSGRLLALLPGVALRLQRKVAAAFAGFRGRRDALDKGLAISLLLQVNVVTYYFLIARALGVAVPIIELFLIVPIAFFIMMVPITVNGIGVRESVFVFFFALHGVANAEAVAFAWFAYLLVLGQGMVGGALYALRDNRRRFRIPDAPGVETEVLPPPVPARLRPS